MQPGETLTVGGLSFTIGRRIGTGRTAEVFLLEAGDERLVLKALRRDETGRSSLDPAAFLAEADTLDRLRAVEAALGDGRQRFPRVHARDLERSFFVMDYMPGVPLTDILGRTALSIGQCLSVAIQLADALLIAAEAGVRNVDLKYDSILWDPGTEALGLIDWNVVRPWGPDDDARWLDPDLALVAEVLDRALLDFHGNCDERAPDWGRPFRHLPERWTIYLRVFQLTFTKLVEGPSEADLAALRERLARIAEALDGEPEDLLQWVIERLIEARRLSGEAGRAALIDALAFAELAANARSAAVAFRARELIGQAGDLLGDDADAIADLDATLEGRADQVHVPPGESIELHRMRRLAHTLHAVLGARDALLAIREAYGRVRWQTANKAIERLMRDFERHAAVIEELGPLAHETEGLALCVRALKPLDRAAALVVDDGSLHGHDTLELLSFERDRAAHYVEALEYLEAGVALLRRVPWSEALFARFSGTVALLDEVRAEAASIERRVRTLASAHHAERSRTSVPAGLSGHALDEPRSDDAGDSGELAYGDVSALNIELDPEASGERGPRRRGGLLGLLVLVLLVGAGVGWWLWQARRVDDGRDPPGRILIGDGATTGEAGRAVGADVGSTRPAPDASGVRDASIPDSSPSDGARGEAADAAVDAAPDVSPPAPDVAKARPTTAPGRRRRVRRRGRPPEPRDAATPRPPVVTVIPPDPPDALVKDIAW